MNNATSTEGEALFARQVDIHEKIRKYASESGLSNAKCEPILDGVGNPDAYVSSSPRVMWILKEGWGKETESGTIEGGGYDIWDCWTKNRYNTPTWTPIIKIMYGLRKGGENFQSRDITPGDDEAIDLLNSTAYININKMPARTTSGSLKQEYAFWRDIILKQIEAYAPDVIIFGGVFELFKKNGDIVCDAKLISKTPTQKIAHLYRDASGRLLVNTWHPAYRITSKTAPKEHYIDELVEAILKNS